MYLFTHNLLDTFILNKQKKDMDPIDSDHYYARRTNAAPTMDRPRHSLSSFEDEEEDGLLILRNLPDISEDEDEDPWAITPPLTSTTDHSPLDHSLPTTSTHVPSITQTRTLNLEFSAPSEHAILKINASYQINPSKNRRHRLTLGSFTATLPIAPSTTPRDFLRAFRDLTIRHDLPGDYRLGLDNMDVGMTMSCTRQESKQIFGMFRRRKTVVEEISVTKKNWKEFLEKVASGEVREVKVVYWLKRARRRQAGQGVNSRRHAAR